MEKILFEAKYELKDLALIVFKVWTEWMKNFKVITLKGDMGAGKTTFVVALSKILNIDDAVSSPTFSLVNEYYYDFEGESGSIFHMDWYRIKNASDAINTGLEDLLHTQKGNYCIIEWAEKAIEILPSKYLKIEIITISPDSRYLKLIEVSV